MDSRSAVLPPGAFRLCLAAMVISSHLTRLEIGRLAVLMFFVLSGYWIHRIWIGKFQGRDLPRFYASRYFRIMPLYLVVIVAASLALALPFTLSSLGLLGVATTHDGIGPAWSLDIELQFYLLFPLLILLGTSLAPVAWGLALAAFTVAGWVAYEQFHLVTLAVYLPCFVVGVLISATRFDPGHRGALVSLAAFAAMSAAILLIPATRGLVVQVTRMDRAELLSFFWMLPLTPYIAHSLTRKGGALDRHLGNLSFPLYLVHVPVIALAERAFGTSHPVKALAVLAAFAVAVALYVLVDRPLDALRVRLFERPLRPAPAAI